MMFEYNHFQEICFFLCSLVIGANMDLFFTYVKIISKDIEGTIIKEVEKPKEEQKPKEESVSINAVHSVEENLLNSQV